MLHAVLAPGPDSSPPITDIGNFTRTYTIMLFGGFLDLPSDQRFLIIRTISALAVSASQSWIIKMMLRVVQ
jgi:hypothetical protein